MTELFQQEYNTFLMAHFKAGYDNPLYDTMPLETFKGAFLCTLFGSLTRFMGLDTPKTIMADNDVTFKYVDKDDDVFLFRSHRDGIQILRLTGENSGELTILSRKSCNRALLTGRPKNMVPHKPRYVVYASR